MSSKSSHCEIVDRTADRPELYLCGFGAGPTIADLEAVSHSGQIQRRAQAANHRARNLSPSPGTSVVNKARHSVLDDQQGMWKLLRPEDIGVELTEGMMMEPEASVSAMVFAHPDCAYFTASDDRDGETSTI